MGQRTLVEANNHFPNILSMTEIKARLIERKEILYLPQEETRNMNDLLSIPYLFVITDADGAVIDYCGTGSLRSFLERNNIKMGPRWQ